MESVQEIIQLPPYRTSSILSAFFKCLLAIKPRIFSLNWLINQIMLTSFYVPAIQPLGTDEDGFIPHEQPMNNRRPLKVSRTQESSD